MAISFNEIPQGMRVPFCYVEFDASNAVSGPSIMPFRALLIGQKTTGSATANVPVKVTSDSQAVALFGDGSMLAGMVDAFTNNNKTSELWALPLADAGAGVLATGTVNISGTATAAGTLSVNIAGKQVDVAVTATQDAATVATNLKNAITAKTSLPVTAAVASGLVTITAKNKGVCGNSIRISIEATPTGITGVVVAMASGATNPDVSQVFTAIGDERFNAFALPYTDAANLTIIENELNKRWGPITQNDGHAFGAIISDDVTAATLGMSRNNAHLSILNLNATPTPCWEVAAALAGTVSYYSAIDPARPVQTLPLYGVGAPAIQNRYTQQQRNVLLNSGISTVAVDAGGVVRIERLITTYRKNGMGADDVSMLDWETMATLSYLRYDFRNYFLSKYPRHKLASDGVKISAGQAILTPKIARAEAVSKFRQWESLGLVEDVDQFKKDLIVERSSSDTGRLDFLLPPNLINQLRITAAKIAFLL